MAWVYVGGTSGSGTSNGYTVSLSGTLTGGVASSPAPGDLVVVFTGFGNTASSAPAVSGNNTGAYTPATAAQHVNDTWDTEFQSFYAVMGSAPDTSLTITRTNNTSYGGATTVHVWRGVDVSNPFVGAATPAGGGNTSAINPPAYDPGVPGALIIAGGAGTQATTGVPFTGFTGMSNFVSGYGDGSTADIAVCMASVFYSGTLFDPPVVSGGSPGNNSSSWAGVTIAFRKAPDPSIDAGPGSYGLTGQASALVRAGVVNAQSAAFSTVGQNAALGVGRTMVASAAACDVAGQDASFSISRVIAANSGTYTVDGVGAYLTRDYIVDLQSSAYGIVGQDASLFTGIPSRVFDAGAGTFALSGSASTLRWDAALSAQGAAYDITGADASTLSARQIAAGAGSYDLLGSAAGAIATRYLLADSGSLILVGSQADLSVGYSGYKLDAVAGVFSIVGGAMRFVLEVDMQTQLSEQDKQDIAAAILAAAQATPIHADVKAGQESIATAVWNKTLP